MKPAMLMAGITLMSFPALADQKAADGCAARLTKDAADIYSASAVEYSPGANMRESVKGIARDMVTSGKLSGEAATLAANAAGGCFQMLIERTTEV
jgi:hypothetical protein